jgi:hypothetical protein
LRLAVAGNALARSASFLEKPEAFASSTVKNQSCNDRIAAICFDFQQTANIMKPFHTIFPANPAKLTETDFSEFILWPI